MRALTIWVTMAAAAAAQDFQWPATGPITQTFYGTFSGSGAGNYYDENNQLQFFAGPGALHRSIDIGAPSGAPVLAARGGVVTTVPDNGNGYGNHVVINHGSGYFSLYAHLQSIGATNGSTVAAGQYIGAVGATGNVTGPHLHFEIRYSPSGGAWSYALAKYYIPGANNASVSAGGNIAFDYPNLGASNTGTTPTPTPTPTPAPGGNTGFIPDGTRPLDTVPDNGSGKHHIGKCSGSMAGPPGGTMLLSLGLALLLLRKRP